MLISSWLKSFRTLLQTRPHTTRQIRRRTPDHRRAPARRAEDLEIRSLLTSPDLVAVSPNFGSFVVDGTTLSESPRELKFQFSPGQALDPLTLDAIQIVGSGFDDSFGEGNEISITPGFRGLGDTPDQVLFRFAQPLKDDLYTITIKGTGANPLREDISGDIFNNGQDLSLQFNLDLGAQVRATVPQPVIRNQVLTVTNVADLRDGDTITINDGGSTVVFEFEDSAVGGGTGGNPAINFSSSDSANTVASTIAGTISTALFSGPGVSAMANGSTVNISSAVFSPTVSLNLNTGGLTSFAGTVKQQRDTIIVYFNQDTLNQDDAEDIRFYQLLKTQGTLDPGDDGILLPTSVTYDSTNNYAVLKFAADIPQGTFSLKIGSSSEPDDIITNATNVGMLFDTTGLSQGAYIGDQDGNNDVDLFRVELDAGAQLTATVDPDANLDAAIRVFNDVGAALTPPGVVNAAGPDGIESVVFTALLPGTYYVGVSSVGNIAYTPADGMGNASGTSNGAYVIDLSVDTSINGGDNNSSFTTATDLGVLGTSGQVFTSQIEPQSVALPAYPGGSDEPGHREVPVESHGAGAGTTSSTPGPIPTVSYYFPNQYGTNPQGLALFNQITENQKQRAREIFELFSNLYGFEVRETTSGGIPIITGDIRAFEPGFPQGVSLSTVLIDGSQNWGTSPFGGGWYGTALHEIGHAIGLGHSYDLPSVQGNGPVAEDQYPSAYDITHGQRIQRPDSTDIDLYKFEVADSGTFKAEIVAERLSASSFLDSALRLYKEDAGGVRRLVAQNDDYFSADAYIELELTEAGTYYLGVSSTGNTDYDPTISDSGFGGRSDGLYELRMNFRSDASSALRDATGTVFDGDGDGKAGGDFVFSFRSDNTLFVDKSVATNLTQPATLGQGFFIVSDVSVFKSTTPFNVRIGNEIVTVNTINAAQNRLNVTRNVGGTPSAHAVKAVLTPADADGSAAKPFGVISHATSAAVAGNIVRILANGGADNNVATTADNRPYLVGFDDSFKALEDGSKFEVPKNVVIQVDAGAMLKLQSAVIDAGSSAQGVDRSGGAIQVLGTPNLNAIFTAYGNDAIGGDSDGVTDGANPGDWGGLVFRQDSDFVAIDATTNFGDAPITLNYVNQANITFGGGLVSVGGTPSTFTPVHLIQSRPTITNNNITNSAKGAISAGPDSFNDSRGRIGPEIHGNTVTNNTLNGLVVRFDDSTGADAARLNATARFDDTDIVHIITDNLVIVGNPGGSDESE